MKIALKKEMEKKMCKRLDGQYKINKISNLSTREVQIGEAEQTIMSPSLKSKLEISL